MSFPEPVSFTKTLHSKPYPFIDPSRPELSAAGKNVVVTGGGSGTGNAVAVAFAKAGAKSVSIGAILPNGTTKVISEAADLLVKSQIDAALQSIVAKVGKIEVFVSNAGILQQPGPITPYDVDLFLSGVSEGIRSAFNAFQASLPVAGPDAVVLNTSSCVATITPVPGIPAYAVSKAATLKAMEYFAAENPHVRVVKDSLFRNMAQEYAEMFEVDPSSQLQDIPASLAELCGLETDSTAENNVYYTALQTLSPLLNQLVQSLSRSRALAFTSQMTPSFERHLRDEDSIALLLLALWYEIARQVIWWSRPRARVEHQSISLYLKQNYPNKEKIQEFLP